MEILMAYIWKMTASKFEINSEDFAGLPLAEQLSCLRSRLDGKSAEELLRVCASIRDHEPLAWLSQELSERGWIAEGQHDEWFGGFILSLPDTAILRVLKAIASGNKISGKDNGEALRGAFCRTLKTGLEKISLDRLSAMCIIDRVMKHNFPEERKQWLETIFSRCREKIREGKIVEIPLSYLAQVPAVGMTDLEKLAIEMGKSVSELFRDRRKLLTRDAISILGNAPKAVSQANAEELLSKRVYSDPGHFLVELLQNAEDAGALAWRVVFDRDRILVSHNGIPFDIRDLVGVTSIGQTTKSKEQIGFFGVGFKSVYEVTDRPQIYSGDLQFEIADISIPKLLAKRPENAPPGETLLVLPLKPGISEDRSPAALFKRTVSIDPCVLITLRKMEILDIELTSKAGGPRKHYLKETISPDSTSFRSTLRQQPDGWERSYLVQDDFFTYPGERREAGRPQTTKVMVGLLLDSKGIPTPLEKDSATMYSFLPTAEFTGLRFFVQGHFDLLVDRERITPSSQWNKWIISLVPTQLSRLSQKLRSAKTSPSGRFAGYGAPGTPPSMDGRTPGNSPEVNETIRGFISILPLEEELSAPIFREIPKALPEVLGREPFIPGEKGSFFSPMETLISPSAISSFFPEGYIEGRWLSDGPGNQLPSTDAGKPANRPDGDVLAGLPRYFFPHLALDERGEKVLQSLGSFTLNASGLIDMLERILRNHANGKKPPKHIPAFLSVFNPELFSRLYDLLLNEIESLESGNSPGRSNTLLDRLLELPLIPDSEGKLYRAVSVESEKSPARGIPIVRQLYSDFIPFLAEELDENCCKDKVNHLVTRFLERMGVRVRDSSLLIDDLEKRLGAFQNGLESVGSIEFIGNAGRLSLIHEIISIAPPEHLKRCSRLPIFPASNGKFFPIAKDPSDAFGIAIVAKGPLEERLRRFFERTRPVSPKIESPENPLNLLLARLDPPELSIATLITDLQKKTTLLQLDFDGLRELHDLFDAIHEELNPRTRKQLAELAIWPDTQGTWRPLYGEDAVIIPFDDAVSEFFPKAPFLKKEFRHYRHLKELEMRTGGIELLLEAFSKDISSEFNLIATPENVEKIQRFLLDHPKETTATVLELHLTAPIFFSDRGETKSIRELSTTRFTELRILYGDFPHRHFFRAGETNENLLTLLKIQNHLTKVDAVTLIEDMFSLGDDLVDKESGRITFIPYDPITACIRLFQYLEKEVHRLSKDSLDLFFALPIFPDENGKTGRIGNLRGKIGENDLFPCDPRYRFLLSCGGLRVLHPKVQDASGKLLKSAQIPQAGFDRLINVLRKLTPITQGKPENKLQERENLLDIAIILRDNKTELERRYPPSLRDGLPPANKVLSEIPIWPTPAGKVICADQVLCDSRIRELVGPDTVEESLVRESLLIKDFEPFFDSLQPLIAPIPAKKFLGNLVQWLGIPNEVLEKQPPFLSTISGIRKVLEILLEEIENQPVSIKSIPLVDRNKRLRFDNLRAADDDTAELLNGLPLGADLIHPDFDAIVSLLPQKKERAVRLQYKEILQVLLNPHDVSPGTPAPAAEPARRKLFFNWLISHEGKVFSDPQCRSLLAEAPLFPTVSGNLVQPKALVIESPFPDLTEEWKPSPEIPRELCEVLIRQIGGGRPSLEILLETQFLPSYRKAVEKPDPERAGKLFISLFRVLRNRAPSDVIRIMADHKLEKHLPLETNDGSFKSASGLILPPLEIDSAVSAIWEGSFSRPSSARYPEECRFFMIALGVKELPALLKIRETFENPPQRNDVIPALARVVEYLYRTDNFIIEKELPLRKYAWLLDGKGNRRTPAEMFLWQPEIEFLIGNLPEKFIDARLRGILGEDLSRKLEFRQPHMISPEEIIRNLLNSSKTGRPVSNAVYDWLEQGLKAGKIKGEWLSATLAGHPWVYTDDGRFFPSSKVIGSRAFFLFGERRGYWEIGIRRFPLLCTTCKIQTTVTTEAIVSFLLDIGEEIRMTSDKKLLENDPAIPRLITACSAFLGTVNGAIPQDTPAILCRELSPEKWRKDPKTGEESCPSVLRILPSSVPSLFLSDTPALEKAFSKVGTLHLAVLPAGEAASDVERFYSTMGIRKLRNSYRIVPDQKSGDDVTEFKTNLIQQMKITLRALASVIPRVKLHRSHLNPTGWREKERLHHIATAGTIKAINKLTVRGELDRVGEIPLRAQIFYDDPGGSLFLDTQVIEFPEAYTSRIAAGILPCIYEGSGEDGLLDLIEILVSKRNKQDMHIYLDLRQFPSTPEPGSPVDRLRERLGEFLDFGIEKLFMQKFPETVEAAWEKWRNPALPVRLSERITFDLTTQREFEKWIEEILPGLVSEIEILSPSPELSKTLHKILSVASLNDIAGELRPTREEAGLVEGNPFSVQVSLEAPKKGEGGAGDIVGPGKETEGSAKSSPSWRNADTTPSVAVESTGWFGKIADWLGSSIFSVLKSDEPPQESETRPETKITDSKEILRDADSAQVSQTGVVSALTIGEESSRPAKASPSGLFAGPSAQIYPTKGDTSPSLDDRGQDGAVQTVSKGTPATPQGFPVPGKMEVNAPPPAETLPESIPLEVQEENELKLLQTAVQKVAKIKGVKFARELKPQKTAASNSAEIKRLRKLLEQALGNPGTLETFLSILKFGLAKIDRIGDDIKQLDKLGLIKIQPIQFTVEAIDPKAKKKINPG